VSAVGVSPGGSQSPPRFLKVRHVAAILGCDPGTVRRHCRQGHIKATKCGNGSWLIFASPFADFCDPAKAALS